MSTEFLMDDHCFACGVKNINGLKLKITESNDGVEALIRPPLWSQGYNQVVHGGILATILDEMAVWAAFKKGYKSVTAELNMRIKKAMEVDHEYKAKARVVAIKHGLIEAESDIMDKENQLIASARVKLIRVEP